MLLWSHIIICSVTKNESNLDRSTRNFTLTMLVSKVRVDDSICGLRILSHGPHFILNIYLKENSALQIFQRRFFEGYLQFLIFLFFLMEIQSRVHSSNWISCWKLEISPIDTDWSVIVFWIQLGTSETGPIPLLWHGFFLKPKSRVWGLHWWGWDQDESGDSLRNNPGCVYLGNEALTMLGIDSPLLILHEWS